MKPLFIHDCDKCRFLGNMIVPIRDEVADVYMSCGNDMQAVIFRWSDDPPDYSHVLLSILDRYFKPSL